MNSFQHTLRASLVFGGGAALLLLLFFIHIGQGQANISYSMIIDALISPNQSLEHQTLIMLRLPRAVIAILAGGALAASGVILQTLTKNPLAEASTMGIHSGAYFFLVTATIFYRKVCKLTHFFSHLSVVQLLLYLYTVFLVGKREPHLEWR